MTRPPSVVRGRTPIDQGRIRSTSSQPLLTRRGRQPRSKARFPRPCPLLRGLTPPARLRSVAEFEKCTQTRQFICTIPTAEAKLDLFEPFRRSIRTGQEGLSPGY